MREAVIVDAARTPIGKGRPITGWLSGFHAVQTLSLSIEGVLKRNGVDRKEVEQVVAGCVTMVGEQSCNIARQAWLWPGDNLQVGAVSLDCQCGSGHHAVHVANSLVQSGAYDVAIGSGIEQMSHVSMGANFANGPGHPYPEPWPWDDPRSQFEAVTRICKNRGITKEECDQMAFESQAKAIAATEAGKFKKEIIPVEAPIVGEDGKLTGETRLVDRDQGLRATKLEDLANLKTFDSGGFVSAATASQISDGSSSVLIMTAEKAKELGLTPRARIKAGVLVGSDPYYVLDGPVDATKAVLKKAGMNINDIDLYEVNEAFAGVTLSWCRVFDPDMSRLNVNGGAMALGHPVASTGPRMIATALHELERTGKSNALITMCCGSSVGTASIIERI
ncbi:MAG: steroid 3-ketoacyl-CoA thiolase [Desulfobacteraceae bacterium]|jgi:acetyl-CoA C-acetyltransferase|nr:steroid 3-ketoacyl-CoA thiolase [Desulfobacteraceae bacterium]